MLYEPVWCYSVFSVFSLFHRPRHILLHQLGSSCLSTLCTESNPHISLLPPTRDSLRAIRYFLNMSSFPNWPSMIIVVVGQESIPLPSLSSAPVSSSIDSRALLSLVTEGTVEHYWKEQVVSKIRQSLFRLPSGQSLLVRVLTVEAWWNTQIRKQLMELSSRDPSLDQVKTDIVLWSLLFPKPGQLVTFCRAFAQLRRV